MGCWKETCGLTQLPICAGDEVILYIIKVAGKRISDGLCYSSDVCSPMFFGIKGTYDDYGAIEETKENFNTETILKWANEQLRIGNKNQIKLREHEANPETVKRPNLYGIFIDEDRFTSKYRDKKFEEREIIEKFDHIEDFIKMIERGRVQFEGKEVALMMIRKDVYDSIIEATIEKENEDSLNYLNWVEKVGQKTAKSYGVTQKDIDDRKIDYKDKISKDIDYFVKWMKSKDKYGGNWGKSVILKSCLGYNRVPGSMYGEHGYQMSDLYDQIKEKFDNDLADDEFIEYLKNELFNFIIFQSAMADLRKLWIPQSGKGSQSSEFELYKKLGKIISDISDKEISDQKEQEENML